MTMTPSEIENRRFRKGWRGFDTQEVLEFLAQVSEEMLELASRFEELERDHAEMARRVKEYRARDGAIQDALLSVRKLADDMREEARREAELIVREARIAGEAIIRQARDQATRIEDETIALRVERDSFEDKVRGAAEEHLRLIEARREEAQVREKLRILSLRHGPSAPPLSFTETMGLPASGERVPDASSGRPGDPEAN